MIRNSEFLAESNLLRRIYYIDDGCHYIISTEEFERSLILDGKYLSDEARYIDEQIFCYVPEEVFNSSDEQICSFIRENIL